jgi:2',3'-cyclic-nucleotide 2'-phosphodiesterase (5'-nucleotidase family)
VFQIFHTNDVHSAFEALASLQTVLVSQRREGDLLLDAGDFHDFKSILLQGTQGRAGKRILSAMNYDAVAIGNNEGYSSVPNLEAMSEDDVPLLSCNLVRRNGEELPFIRKSCIIQKKDQRFLIIG